MDHQDTPPRRGRATAGATMLGATALLVLSFGPAALAISPSPSTAPTSRAAVSAPAAHSAPELPRRATDGKDLSDR